MSDRLDLVVFGATGFVGKQCAHYVSEHAPAGLRFALAGRRHAALEDVAAGLEGAGPERLLVADSADPSSIDAMVGATGVILTTVGPFAKYGSPVVEACVRHRTDYVDITGETQWVRRMIDAHHDEAVAGGTRVVPFCGYDSVPSDLGAQLAVEELRRRGAEPGWVRGFHGGAGGLNGGTLASALNIGQGMDELKRPFLLNPAPVPSSWERECEDVRGPYFDPVRKRWAAPFFMGPINTRVVRRSQALLTDVGQGYGEAFRYQEYLDLGSRAGRLTAVAVAAGMRAAEASLALGPMRALAARFGPAPGEGPSEAAMDGGYFRSEFVAEGVGGERALIRLQGEGDPGNRTTTRLLCEAAFCLLEDRARLDERAHRGGLLTPATAFGEVLRDRLLRAGVQFEVVER